MHNKDSGQYSITINSEKIKKENINTGWLIIVTNDLELNTKDVIKIYRRKDIIEKSFCRLKNNLYLKRLRIHSDSRIYGKFLISTIALIINSYIYSTAKDSGLLHKFTIEEMLKELDKIKLLKYNDKSTISPVSKANRDILKAFGYKIDELIS
jgi:transposase